MHGEDHTVCWDVMRIFEDGDGGKFMCFSAGHEQKMELEGRIRFPDQRNQRLVKKRT